MNRDFAEMLAALSAAGAEFIAEGRNLPFLGRADLIANKRTAGRPRDMADVAELEDQDRS